MAARTKIGAIRGLLLAVILSYIWDVASSPLGPLNDTTMTSYQCINSDDWATPNFHPQDCQAAIEEFHRTDVLKYTHMLLEFRAKGVPPLIPIFSQSTPRRYVYGTCTVAIIMMTDMQNLLPGTYFVKNTDLSTYVFLENAAKNVREGCISPMLGEQGDQDGVNFVNPTGYDVAGAYCTFRSLYLSAVFHAVLGALALRAC